MTKGLFPAKMEMYRSSHESVHMGINDGDAEEAETENNESQQVAAAAGPKLGAQASERRDRR